MGDGDKAITFERVEQAADQFEEEVGAEVDDAKEALVREDLGTSLFTAVLWRLAVAYEFTHNYAKRQVDHNREDVTGVQNALRGVAGNYRRAEDDATMPDPGGE